NMEAATGLAIRERDLKLIQAPNLAAALQDANGVIVVPAAERVSVSEELLKNVLEQTQGSCFVHGCLATSQAGARRLGAIAGRQKVSLSSGTPVATTFRLPDVEVPADSAL